MEAQGGHSFFPPWKASKGDILSIFGLPLEAKKEILHRIRTTDPCKRFGKKSRKCRRGLAIGRVGGRGWALMRREAVVRSVMIHSRTILRVFMCVPANVRVWVRETCVLCRCRLRIDTWRGSGRKAFAATQMILGGAESHYPCHACCSAHKSLPCRTKTLGVIRWRASRRSL